MERGSRNLVYPITLDGVLFNGKKYQVAASAQTGNVKTDMYVLKDVQTQEVIRVTGAAFTPEESRVPGAGSWHLKDEGVRITGSLNGGQVEGK